MLKILSYLNPDIHITVHVRSIVSA
jgi:hypothetical protein